MNQQIGHHTVRVLGRTVMDGGMLWMLSSLSEAGFRVTGARHLEMVLRSDDTTTDPSRAHLTPRYAVLVDGDIVMDHCMKEPEETITVFDSGVPWGAEIRFRKLSECTQSIMAIREIRTDGKIVPLEEHGPRIEFIGDSITCGYGVEGKNELEDFTGPLDVILMLLSKNRIEIRDIRIPQHEIALIHHQPGPGLLCPFDQPAQQIPGEDATRRIVRIGKHGQIRLLFNIPDQILLHFKSVLCFERVTLTEAANCLQRMLISHISRSERQRSFRLQRMHGSHQKL